MSLKFCPNCSNLLTYTNTPDRQLIMKCHSCGNPVTDISNVCVYYNKFVQNSYDIKIDPDQCYDNALPYTDEIPCLNPECPSNGYSLFLQRQFDEIAKELGEEVAREEFEKQDRISMAQERWGGMTEEQRNTYKKEADVLPQIKYFHYNKDMKLAYICCLCQTYWKN